MPDERHIFISHIHEDDEHVQKLKDLLEKHGMVVDNGSITKDKFNNAQNEDYIKNDILAPRIEWASCLVVLVSEDTKDSDYVNWEIEEANRTDTRIVAVYENGEAGCELPEAAKEYADAVVSWDGGKIVDAINGEDCWQDPSGDPRPQQDLKRHNC
ncbi:MAG: hypothetical protein JWR83_1613 [Aeromicrobium sp.]|nr:hypothetical protein [Aeromicrobium sp.]